MITLDITKEKVLTFHNEVVGTTIKPRARLIIPLSEDTSLIFEAGEINNNVAKIKIPPLKNYISEEKDTINNAKLEIIIEDKKLDQTSLFTTWTSDIRLIRPLKIGTVLENISEENNITEEKQIQIKTSSLLKEEDNEIENIIENNNIEVSSDNINIIEETPSDIVERFKSKLTDLSF